MAVELPGATQPAPHQFTPVEFERLAGSDILADRANGAHALRLEHGAVWAGDRAVRFTTEQFLGMDSAGILDPGRRVELLDGVVWDLTVPNMPHAFALRALEEWVRANLTDGFAYFTQASLRLSRDGVPQPDLMVVRGDWRGYSDLPTERDVVFVAEGSDASLHKDLAEKLPVYAAHGVADYLVLDVNGRVVHAFSRPLAGGAYEQHDLYEDADHLAVPGCGGARVPVVSLFLQPENSR